MNSPICFRIFLTTSIYVNAEMYLALYFISLGFFNIFNYE